MSRPLPHIDVETLIVGAGVSGLGFASFWKEERAKLGKKGSVVVVEKASEPGGWCRTVNQDGFVWDYSGHFFHFRHKDIEERLVSRLPAGSVRTIQKKARVVDVTGAEVAFPYQRNIAQLPFADFARCLSDLYKADQEQQSSSGSFKQMLQQRLGTAICERFLVPYNEKLYATDLDRLDPDAMGRFFPTTSFKDVMASLDADATAAAADYNATFTYPRGGAVEYVNALLRDLVPGELRLNETITAIDLPTKTATTSAHTIRFDRLITSAPLPSTLAASSVDHDKSAFTGNRVLVFNLGFDSKGRSDAHWIYYADPKLPFYRVGFYDNIFSDNRMSLYVEIGLKPNDTVDVDAARAAVLVGLEAAGVITSQKLVSWHAVLMDPAYVHITAASLTETARARGVLDDNGVFSIGRYGGWTYCSIEDNLVEARALARRLAAD